MIGQTKTNNLLVLVPNKCQLYLLDLKINPCQTLMPNFAFHQNFAALINNNNRLLFNKKSNYKSNSPISRSMFKECLQIYFRIF